LTDEEKLDENKRSYTVAIARRATITETIQKLQMSTR